MFDFWIQEIVHVGNSGKTLFFLVRSSQRIWIVCVTDSQTEKDGGNGVLHCKIEDAFSFPNHLVSVCVGGAHKKTAFLLTNVGGLFVLDITAAMRAYAADGQLPSVRHLGRVRCHPSVGFMVPVGIPSIAVDWVCICPGPRPRSLWLASSLCVYSINSCPTLNAWNGTTSRCCAKQNRQEPRLCNCVGPSAQPFFSVQDIGGSVPEERITALTRYSRYIIFRCIRSLIVIIDRQPFHFAVASTHRILLMDARTSSPVLSWAHKLHQMPIKMLHFRPLRLPRKACNSKHNLIFGHRLLILQR